MSVVCIMRRVTSRNGGSPKCCSFSPSHFRDRNHSSNWAILYSSTRAIIFPLAFMSCDILFINASPQTRRSPLQRIPEWIMNRSLNSVKPPWSQYHNIDQVTTNAQAKTALKFEYGWIHNCSNKFQPSDPVKMPSTFPLLDFSANGSCWPKSSLNLNQARALPSREGVL